MSSLPTYSNMPLSLLDRTESLPNGNGNDQVGAGTIAVPAMPGTPSMVSVQQQPSHNVPGPYGYSTSYALPFFVNPHDASSSQVQTEGAEAFRSAPPYPLFGANMPGQAYGYSVHPTMAPRYPMTGTPYAPPNPGCISPLDLFTNPAVPSFTVSAPPTGTATSFDHTLFMTSTMSPQLSFGNAPFTPELSLPRSVPPSALVTSAKENLLPTLSIGLTIPETPISSDSAPDTALESPMSESDDDEMDDGRVEEEEGEDEAMEAPKTKVDKIKIKLAKGSKGKKDGEEEGKDEAAVKKRSRTAQACEKCRVRKARCFGGNPCHRCTKRNFVCEFTPSRVRVPAPKAETKPKIRRHSMHTVGASGPSQLATGQPGVNGIIPSPVPHAPLSRVQSHNHVYTQPRATPYTRPPLAHSHSMSAGVNMPLPSPTLALPRTATEQPIGGGNPYLYGHPHAHTQPLAQVPLPQLHSPMHASAFYGVGYQQIPSFEQMQPPSTAAQLASSVPTTSLMPAFSSSLGLNLGTSLPSSGLGLGLGLDMEDEAAFNSSPSDRSPDVPALSGSSTSSLASGDALTSFTASGTWSGVLDTSTLPIVEEDMFNFSPVPENDGIYVVGWDDDGPGMSSSCAAESNGHTTSTSTSITIGQQVEGVRDAATRQLYGVNNEWYGQTR